MKFIVKLFPEIIVKSRPVRTKMTNQLVGNLKKLLRDAYPDLEIVNRWDRVEIDGARVDISNKEAIIEILLNTPGIHHFFSVKTIECDSIEEIGLACAAHFADEVKGKTFVARVKRSGNQSFTSIEAEREIGAAILRNCEPAGVKLKNPEYTVKAEIYNRQVNLVETRYEGLGGFPLSKQDQALSLISGGFDSTVASYMTIARGTLTHFCFFNLGGIAHEVGVKQVSHFIWKKYGASHDVKFISVPFDGVLGEILKNVNHSYMGVILKRMMMRAAAHMAQKLNIPALVTGEAIAQVSSQTLQNLSVIDKSTDHLIIRPLITTDKQDIIDMADHIGTGDYAKNMPEYCGVISNRPTTAAKLDKVIAEEENFDFAILDKAIEDAIITRMMDLMHNQKELGDIEVTSLPTADDIILDIRHPTEEEESPLVLTNNSVVKLPFYELNKKFKSLDMNKDYLLYCDRGVMSKMQALQLVEDGYKNIKVYQK
jgi:tRNA uracil 4-sulfurtransferase